jgi:C4-dicarboxylate-specific signal transduction histidine kinase
MNVGVVIGKEWGQCLDQLIVSAMRILLHNGDLEESVRLQPIFKNRKARRGLWTRSRKARKARKIFERSTSMKFDLIEQAKIEAYRFIAKANNAEKRVRTDRDALFRCKEMASLKRASLDLSRVLAELRK